jgi:serine/threonine protein kinase
MPLVPGDVVQGRYRIEDHLAPGGMSAVYRAWDSRLQVACALKEMVPYPGMDEKALIQLRDQFLQEAQVLAELRHPNMPRVTDHFEYEDNAYLVMDYVDGPRLDTIIEENGRIKLDVLKDWAKELLNALSYCHQQGVLHRDVKPQNVIITPEGEVKLVDFGLAKVLDIADRKTRTVMRGLGTPEYAPPEQYDAEPGSTDARSDIYGLGATLYHALTGTPPPTATQRIVDPSLLKPVSYYVDDMSPDVDNAIIKSMALQPSQRFQTVSEMANTLFGPPGVKTPSRPLGNGAEGATNPLATIALSDQGRGNRQRVLAGAGGGMVVMVIALFFVLRGGFSFGATATGTPTSTPTVTAISTATATPSPTASATPTPTATGTATASATPTPTPTIANTPTATPSRTPQPTRTRTSTPTVTKTGTPTLTPTNTPTRIPTRTPTPTPTATPTFTPPPPRPPTRTATPLVPTPTYTRPPTNTPTRTTRPPPPTNTIEAVPTSTP